MHTGILITAIAVFLLAGTLFFLGVRQLLERGVLLNNTWLYATKEEREKLNKKPYYRQSGTVFCLLGLLFTVIGLYALLQSSGLLWLEAALAVGTVAYAILSTVQISRAEQLHSKPRR